METLDKFKNLGFNLFGALLITALLTTLVSAQALPGFPAPPEGAPIDGGLSLLAAAGGAYAIKKLRDKKTE